MKKIIDNFSIENKFSFYSAFFRIFICFHLLKKIFLSWEYKDLLYMSKSFFVHEESGVFDFFNISSFIIRENFQIFYLIYLVLIVLYFFGIGKNITALILFAFFEVLQNLCPSILNGGDNLLKFIMIYMIFIDSYNYFSIKPKLFKNSELSKFNIFLSNLGGYSICIHLCLAYFISAIHKIHADIWFNGIATYYTMSLERFRGTSFNLSLAKNALFVTLSTYGTILIELFYPALVWFKKTKKTMIILAVILHMSIYVFMMIYDFQLVFIFVQGFFISNTDWVRFYDKRNLLDTANKLTIYIDGWCPICKKFKNIVFKLDFFKLIEIKDIRESDIIDEKKLKLMFSKSDKEISFYGFDSIYEINKRLVVLWILLPFSFILKITKIGNFLYNELSVKRKIIPLYCDTECNLN